MVSSSRKFCQSADTAAGQAAAAPLSKTPGLPSRQLPDPELFGKTQSVNGHPDAGRSTEKDGEVSKALRLLQMISMIREDPYQPLQKFLDLFGISRSQFYKDRKALAQLGFRFEYSKSKGFRVTEDKLLPVTGFSLSDRLVLMLALEQLSAADDGTIAAMAVDAGRKLVGGLPSPFKEQLLACFDAQVTSGGFGVDPVLLARLRDAVTQSRRISILYTRSGTWEQRWRLVDPRHIYMRQKTLYL